VLGQNKAFFQKVFEADVSSLPKSDLSLYGAMFQLKGRLNGSDRSKRFLFSFGQVSLSSVDSFVDYSHKRAITPYGCLGVKV
jgi:ribosomal protein S3